MALALIDEEDPPLVQFVERRQMARRGCWARAVTATQYCRDGKVALVAGAQVNPLQRMLNLLPFIDLEGEARLGAHGVEFLPRHCVPVEEPILLEWPISARDFAVIT